MTIEAKLTRLEEIVEQLEAEPLDLARSLALFEEGISCLRDASSSLNEAEARVKRLTEQADGALAIEDFDDD